MSNSSHDALIIGGGITGLAAAYRLRRDAPELDVRLIEATDRIGGKIGTHEREGFLLETGPDCFLSRKPRGLALCHELRLGDQLIGRNEGYVRTYVRRHGRLHLLPAGLSGMVPTDLVALESSTLLSADARARVAAEPSIPPSTAADDESVEAFFVRRLGREVFESLIEPLMGGIYAGQADQLSLAATFPQLRTLEKEQGSLLVGLQDASRAAVATEPPFVSLRAGMATLVETLGEALGTETIFCGTQARSVVAKDDGYVVDWENADGTGTSHARAVILATPAFAAARLVKSLDRDLAAHLGDIPYASSALVTLAYTQEGFPHPLDGYGYVVPRAEGGDVLACTWTSRKWQDRAPREGLLIRVYLGRYGQADVTAHGDEQLFAMAREELRDTLGVDVTPLFEEVQRWPQGMPQYTMGHPARIQEIRSRLAARPGLLIVGAAFEGVGIPDCIFSGETAARQVIERLVGIVIG